MWSDSTQINFQILQNIRGDVWKLTWISSMETCMAGWRCSLVCACRWLKWFRRNLWLWSELDLIPLHFDWSEEQRGNVQIFTLTISPASFQYQILNLWHDEDSCLSKATLSILEDLANGFLCTFYDTSTQQVELSTVLVMYRWKNI